MIKQSLSGPDDTQTGSQKDHNFIRWSFSRLHFYQKESSLQENTTPPALVLPNIALPFHWFTPKAFNSLNIVAE